MGYLNKVPLQKLIKVIENEDSYFNMNYFSAEENANEIPRESNFCETPSCIAGHVNYQHAVDTNTLDSFTHPRASDTENASKVLGIDSKMKAYKLFYDCPINQVINRQLAIRVLKNLDETGEVDWYTE